ncbi:unnamed protein product [Cunninghamella blakesleeana]
MKVISHLAGLSATATLLLQVGHFVEASPFFASDVQHGNDATITDQCQGFAFTLPDTSITIENNSRHAVAWSVPESLKQSTLQLSLVNKDDNSKTINIGQYGVIKGATNEFNVNTDNEQPGTYFFQLKTTDNSCTINSSDITINPQQQTTTATHSNEDDLISLINEYHEHPDAVDVDDNNNINTTGDEHYDELNRIVNGLPPVNHPNNSNHFDDIIDQFDTIQNEPTSAFASNEAHFDDIIDQFDTIQNEPTSAFASNEAHFDDIIDQFDTIQTESPSSNDDHFNQIIDQLDAFTEPNEAPKEVHVNLADILDDANDVLHNKQHPNNKNTDKIIDKIAEKVNDQNNKKQSHNNDVEETNDKTNKKQLESFDELISSYDQDYTKFLQNNKESKPDNTIHKNADDLNESSTTTQTNNFFTNTDLRTSKKNQKRDERDSHVNAIETDNAPPSELKWHVDSAYFTNEDHSSHPDDHLNAEWQEESNVNDPSSFSENATADEQPHWNMDNAYFSNEDHRHEDSLSWEEVSDEPSSHPDASNDHMDDAEEVNGEWAEEISSTHIDEDFNYTPDADASLHSDDVSPTWIMTDDNNTNINNADGHENLHWDSVHENANVDEDFSIGTEYATDEAIEVHDDHLDGEWDEPEIHPINNEGATFAEDDVHTDASNDHMDDAEEVNGEWAEEISSTHIDEDFNYTPDADASLHSDDVSPTWIMTDDNNTNINNADGHENLHWDSVHENANVDEDFSIGTEYATDEAIEVHDDHLDGEWSEPEIHLNVNEDFSFAEDDVHTDASNDHMDDAEEVNGEWAEEISTTHIDEDFNYTPDASHTDASMAWVMSDDHINSDEQDDAHWDSIEEAVNVHEDFDMNMDAEQATLPFESTHKNDLNWVTPESLAEQENVQKTETDDQHNNDAHWNVEEIAVQPEWHVPESNTEAASHDNQEWASDAFDEFERLYHENQELETYSDIIPFEDHTNSLHWDSEMNQVEKEVDDSHFDHEDGEWHEDDEFPLQKTVWSTNAEIDEGDYQDDVFEVEEGEPLHDDAGFFAENIADEEEHYNEWHEDGDDTAVNADGAWATDSHDNDAIEWSDAIDQFSEDDALDIDGGWATDSHDNDAIEWFDANDQPSEEDKWVTEA